jgi:hypothetical protein
MDLEICTCLYFKHKFQRQEGRGQRLETAKTHFQNDVTRNEKVKLSSNTTELH